MDITKKVALARFRYHTNMLDVCNVLNQLGALKDEKAEDKMKHHAMKSIECINRLGPEDIEKHIVKKRKS